MIKNTHLRFVFIAALFICIAANAQKKTIELCKNIVWTFKKADDKIWLPATVPGTVHTDLLTSKKISDPFYRNNEKDLQWIDKADWEYKASIDIDTSILSKDVIELYFEGLDTYADVYLNDTKILTADNMFRSWKVNVKSKLKNGANELRIYFHSPINKTMPAFDVLGYEVPVSNNDQGEKKLSVYTRKAGYHYGWDWGPRFVTSGIWRPISLIAWNRTSIEDVFIKQKSITKNTAFLEASVEANTLENGMQTMEVYDANSNRLLAKKELLLYKGTNFLNVPFNVSNPELWWPSGMGKQHLYSFKIVLKDVANKIVLEKTVRRGLREIELVQESDSKGRSFYFKVNGKPIFMKGANYIPQDNFLPTVTKERYEHILNSAVAANMNMLRVWGGGVYQSNLFYDLCDEKGILVWQDFMFACAMLPPFENLKQNIYEEAAENVKRLRNHASIAMYCGNNEVVQFFSSNFWGHVKQSWKTPQDSIALFDTYKDVFHQILPAVIKAYDADKPYWSSSPNADNYSMKYTPNKRTGELHYWGVWAGNDTIEQYNINVPRFMSEYGFQSFPEMASIKTFSDSTDYDLNSAVMTGHQRSTRGNGGIMEYMGQWFKTPKAFDKFTYVGQLLQSEAVRIAIEAHRRGKPFCMGSLFWQIDDCWPAASWSSIDYYGRWKALQYQAKRSFEKLLLSSIDVKDSINIHLISDSLKTVNGILEIRLMDFNGKMLKQLSKPISLEADGSKIVQAINKKEWLGNANGKQVVLEIVLKNEQKTVASNLCYFEKPKDLDLPTATIKHVITKQGDAYSITLSANKLVRFVNMSIGEEIIVLSDNFYDLLPNQSKRITFKSPLSLEKINQLLTIVSLKDNIDN